MLESDFHPFGRKWGLHRAAFTVDPVKREAEALCSRRGSAPSPQPRVPLRQLCPSAGLGEGGVGAPRAQALLGPSLARPSLGSAGEACSAAGAGLSRALRAGEEHYNCISALHKSMRGSDASAALYWLGRMLEGGEDPLYVARRLVRFASEDVGE